MRWFGKPKETYDDLVESIKHEEGFVGKQYDDHLGFATIGYGTKLPLTHEEAELLLKHRLDKAVKELIQKKPIVEKLPVEARIIVLEMAYQLGVNGVLKFKNMWAALECGDYSTAAFEMTDSLWSSQTPERAQRLAARMKTVGFTA